MDIVQMSLSASVLIVAVVIIRALTLYKLPKKTFLVLWGVVICRLLIPFSVPSRFSFYTGIDMVKRVFADKTDASSPAGILVVPDMSNLPSVGEPMGVSAPAASISPLEILWLVGICACALFFIVAYIKCRREFKMSLPAENGFVALWLRDHPLRRPVQIRQSDRIKAPLTYGVFRPVVLLPITTDWTDETRLRYILTHEYAHIRRFDTLKKLALTAAVCVHWFNPLVWLMYVLANRDIELSCDEIVIRTFGETMKSAYALTLIALEEKKGRLTPLVNNFSKNAIEERIVSIMKIKKMSLAGIILALVLVIGTTAVFATNGANAKDVSSGGINYSDPSNSTAPEATATTPVLENPLASSDNESVSNNTNSSNEEVEEANPADVPANTAAPAPADNNTSTQEPAPVSESTDGETDESSFYVFPVNKNGETYGSMSNCAQGQRAPDLIAAIGTEGQDGYIRRTEWERLPSPNTPEEAAAYMEKLKTLPTEWTIPLYDQEGNVVGEFLTGNGDSSNGKSYDSLEEAREAVRNGE